VRPNWAQVRPSKEVLLLQIAPSQPEGNVLAAFEFSVARQHGIGHEKPSTLYVQEQTKRRSKGNASGDLHSSRSSGRMAPPPGRRHFSKANSPAWRTFRPDMVDRIRRGPDSQCPVVGRGVGSGGSVSKVDGSSARHRRGSAREGPAPGALREWRSVEGPSGDRVVRPNPARELLDPSRASRSESTSKLP
jgi:hypothetical protein